MKMLALAVCFLLVMTGLSFAKAPFKAALGLEECTACHKDGDFKADNSEASALYKKAKEMVAMGKEGGPNAGKDCMSCHQGKQKPAAAPAPAGSPAPASPAAPEKN